MLREVLLLEEGFIPMEVEADEEVGYKTLSYSCSFSLITPVYCFKQCMYAITASFDWHFIHSPAALTILAKMNPVHMSTVDPSLASLSKSKAVSI